MLFIQYPKQRCIALMVASKPVTKWDANWLYIVSCVSIFLTELTGREDTVWSETQLVLCSSATSSSGGIEEHLTPISIPLFSTCLWSIYHDRP